MTEASFRTLPLIIQLVLELKKFCENLSGRRGICLCSFQAYHFTAVDQFQSCAVAEDPAQKVNGTISPWALIGAHGSRSEEYAEGSSHRPVTQITNAEDFLSSGFLRHVDGYFEVNFLPPGVHLAFQGQSLPDCPGSGAVIQFCWKGKLVKTNLDLIHNSALGRSTI